MSTLKVNAVTNTSGNIDISGIGKVLQFKTSASSTTGSGFPSYSSNNINNTETTIGSSLTINRKSASSYFIITVSTLVGRAATSSWGFLGYQYSFAGASNNQIYDYLADNQSSVRYTVQYINSTSGSVGDAVVVQGYYKNTASHNDNVRQPTINITEYQP